MSAFAHLLPDRHGTPTVNLTWIRKQLGFRASDDLLVTYIEALIEQREFPRPFPHLARGGMLSDDIHPMKSEWIRAAVEAWLASFLPPSAAAAIDAAAAREAAADMDAMAGNLRIVGGVEA
jgi:hypothetical protein